MLHVASWTRPYFWPVVFTAVLLAAGGVWSAFYIPSGVYPEVTFPRIAVVAKVPTLGIDNMQVQVTQPLERALSGVIGVSRVRSKTIGGGSELSLDFYPSTDMVRAEQLTWNRISTARSELPPETELAVERMTPSVVPIISVILTGGDNPAQLREYAFYELAPQIKSIPDVLYANVTGGDVREIEVEARPTDLLAAGLSAADLADQIAKVHRLQPVGRVEQKPFAYRILVDTQGETPRNIEELVIATRNNQPVRVRDVAEVRVGHEDRVQSIGYANKDAVVITIFRTLKGNTLNISNDVTALLEEKGLKRPTPESLRQRCWRYARGLLGQQVRPPRDPDKWTPGNIQATPVYDQATFVTTAVDNVRDAILVGGFFSILILMLFLRSWRATFISALAIPTTLAITLLILYWTGATFNLMSLGGLAVAIGLIIDDTVVVIENIARHLSPQAMREVKGPGGAAPAASADGQSPAPQPSGAPASKPRDPVDAASGEITGAVVGSTLTTVLVFLPLVFVVGVYGQFFASLAWALAVAVLVSMVISLTLVPVFAAKFLAGRPMPPPGRIYHFVANVYERALEGTLHHPVWTLGVSVLALAVGALLLFGIPDVFHAQQQGKPPPDPLVSPVQTGLMPIMDEGAFTVDYFAPPGTPLQETEEKVKTIEEVLSDNPDVKAYVRRTGAEMGIFATQSSRGDIQTVLRPAENDPISLLLKPVRPPLEDLKKELRKAGKEWNDKTREEVRRKYRRRSAQQVMKEIEDAVGDSFSDNQLKVDLAQIMEDELNDLSGSGKPVEVKFFGPDYGQLRKLAEKLNDVMEEKGKGRGFGEINAHAQEGDPDLRVRVNGVSATRLGITAADVERQLKVMYFGQVATQVRESSARIIDVRVRYPDSLRFGQGWFEPDRVLNQWILLPEATTPTSADTTTPPTVLAGPARTVPLSALARANPARGVLAEQWRENQQPLIFVEAELDETKAGLGSANADVNDWMKEIHLPSSNYRWEMGGHYKEQQEIFFNLFLVLAVAILLIYLMLAFQFRSVVLPLLIFMEQPLSLVSGLFALWITHTPLNVSSYMGAILLIGLDMKNGIILVEYIQQLRSEGVPLEQAILEAGRTRLRPILMTSLAAILGLLPLAFGIGPGSQMQQPLAIMVIGGLTANMLFARMVIRAGYMILEGRSARPPAAVAPVSKTAIVAAKT